MAGGSAALTFVILASFAVIVGALTNRQVRSQFDNQLSQSVDQLVSTQLDKTLTITPYETANCHSAVSLGAFASAEQAQIRIFDSRTSTLLCTQKDVRGRKKAIQTPLFNTAPPPHTRSPFDESGYRVVVREGIRARRPRGAEITLVYAQPLSNINTTLARVQAFLLLGVLGGAVLALLAGLFVSERAMSPIKELTSAAREIGRTEDTRRRIPHPEAEDEIAELARTLEGMLGALDAARARTQSLLDRQREFVADASHELRTPLTSVLANLELLTEDLEGQPGETAEAALRSTRRMRRLVGDLLLLARGDVARSEPHRPVDLGQVLIEAAAELGPMAADHELSIDPGPGYVSGVRDELHRLILNLLENTMRHTPPGTRVCAATYAADGGVSLVVEDSGPGIPPELSGRVFDRFVRGGRDGGRGSGLGLAIVRAVAASHGGTVAIEPSSLGTEQAPGARFVIRLPAAQLPAEHDVGDERDVRDDRGDQTSTTTGRTIGRRRSRS